MQHHRFDMTFPALCKRADEVEKDNTVANVLHNDDYREINVFLRHEQEGWGDGWKTTGKEIIGVALIDLDDDSAPIEVLTRDEAVDMFGWKWAEQLEVVE